MSCVNGVSPSDCPPNVSELQAELTISEKLGSDVPFFFIISKNVNNIIISKKAMGKGLALQPNIQYQVLPNNYIRFREFVCVILLNDEVYGIHRTPTLGKRSNNLDESDDCSISENQSQAVDPNETIYYTPHEHFPNVKSLSLDQMTPDREEPENWVIESFDETPNKRDPGNIKSPFTPMSTLMKNLTIRSPSARLCRNSQLNTENYSNSNPVSLKKLKNPFSKPIILLTGFSKQDSEKYSAIIKKLKGKKATSPTYCTHLVWGKAYRTYNLVAAMHSCEYIIARSWLDESEKKMSFVDEKKHLFGKDHMINCLNIDLNQSILQRKGQKKLFLGLSFHFSPSIPNLSKLKAIVRAGGGTCRNLLANSSPSTSSDVIVISQDDTDIHKYGASAVVVDEFILESSLKQSLSWDSTSVLLGQRSLKI